MFLSRSRTSPAAQSMLGTASPRATLEKAMTGAVSPDDRINAIAELINTKVDDPTQVDFSDQVCFRKRSSYICSTLYHLFSVKFYFNDFLD